MLKIQKVTHISEISSDQGQTNQKICNISENEFLHKFFGSPKTDPVRFKWGFGEGLLKGKFALFEACVKVLYLRGENCLQNTYFYKQKGPVLKRPFNWTGSVFLFLHKLFGICNLFLRRQSFWGIFSFSHESGGIGGENRSL